MDHAKVLVQGVRILMICDKCHTEIDDWSMEFIVMTADEMHTIIRHTDCMPFLMRPGMNGLRRQWGDYRMLPEGFIPRGWKRDLWGSKK